MNLKLVNSRLALAIVAGVGVVAVTSINVEAADIKPVNLIEPYGIYVESYDTSNTADQEDAYLTAISEEYLNRAFADIDEFAYVYSVPDSESDWVGKLYPKNLVTVVEINSEWTKIISGNVQGFVRTSALAIGEDAYLRMSELQQEKVHVTANVLNVRSGPGTNFSIEGKVISGEILEVVDLDAYEDWVKVLYKDKECFVHRSYILVEDIYTFGETKGEEEIRLEEERIALEEAKRGERVVEFAKQFIGNSYVWGGTSLTNGADCSGFVQSIFKEFGVNLPRTSSQQRTAGSSVAYAEIELGDIICYSGHVGIYAGDGQIVNALNSKKGIVLSNANYKEILSVRRVL